MTYKDLIDMALDRVDEDITNPDAVSLRIIKQGLNQAYMLLSTTLDLRSKTTNLEYANPISLPSDFVSIVNLEHSIKGEVSYMDFEIRSDLLFIRSNDIKNGTFTLTYIGFPTVLANNTDVVDLKNGYIYAAVAYAAYVHQLYRKKYQAAQLLLNEYNSFRLQEVKSQ